MTVLTLQVPFNPCVRVSDGFVVAPGACSRNMSARDVTDSSRQPFNWMLHSLHS